jgi:CheY-like chemotaxis protein
MEVHSSLHCQNKKWGLKMQNSQPILLVEDDSVDVMVVARALQDLGVTNKLVHKANGEEALEYLRTETKPCVILLDLNMPVMNGLEFLKVVKADEVLKRIPVVVLTTSNQEKDVSESFKLGAAEYIVKCIGYEEFLERIRVIKRYCDLSELPITV